MGKEIILVKCEAKIVEAEEDQSNLLKNILEFNNKSTKKKGKDKKEILMKVHMLFMKVEN